MIDREPVGQRGLIWTWLPGQAIKHAVFFSLNEAPFVRAAGFSSGGF
jgi:hypothetical protein